MSRMRTLLNAAAVVGSVGAGYFLWSVTSSREELIHKNLSESNPAKMEQTRQMNALVMQVLKEAAQTNDNLARGIDRPGK